MAQESLANETRVGALVYLVEVNTSPSHWPMTGIEETIPDKDDIVRVCKIRTKAGISTRPTVKYQLT